MRPDTAVAAPLLTARDIGRTYTTGPNDLVALQGVNLDVGHGSFVVIKGRSGSGKTTLLNLLGGLDHPTAGFKTPFRISPRTWSESTSVESVNRRS